MEPSSLQMNEPLYLEQRHRKTLLNLLNQYVPGSTVWAFGSRATGKHVYRWSDLDLAVDHIHFDTKCKLRLALIESDLPVLVDILSMQETDPSFLQRIRPDMILVRPLCVEGSAALESLQVL